MNRELAIRVPFEIATWVRSQSGSASEVVLSLARSLWESKQPLGLADPGAGEDRVKLRVPSRVIQFVRKVSRSRESAAAMRKLFAWGATGRALPASSSRPAPVKPQPRAAPLPIPSPVARGPVRLTPANGPLYASQFATFSRQGTWSPLQVDAHLVRTVEVPAREVVSPTDAVAALFQVGAGNAFFALGVIGGTLAIFWYGLKWLAALGSLGKAASGVAAAAKAAPEIASWIPQAAAGLGALL